MSHVEQPHDESRGVPVRRDCGGVGGVSRLKTDGALLRPQLTRCDESIPAADPVRDQAAVFLGCFFPRDMSGVERMDLAVGEELVKVLVVRPRHEVIVAARQDMGRCRNRRQQITQYRVLLGVVPHEPGRFLWVPKTSSGPVNRMNGLKLWSGSTRSWR
jgi:hypothetical protein